MPNSFPNCPGICVSSPTTGLDTTKSTPMCVLLTVREPHVQALSQGPKADPEPGILVSNTPKAVDGATADVAMFLLLGALRRAWQPLSSLREGRWRGHSGLGHDPQDRTLGILGMGGIGTALAVRAAAFGMKIQYHNRHPVPEDCNPTRAAYVSFDELLRSSDVISVHLPLTESTRHTLDREQFQKMKDGVILVNTARGPVINEAALVDALESGKLFSAGLDVYEEEPKIHPKLVENDKVVLLPHIGTATFETQVGYRQATCASLGLIKNRKRWRSWSLTT